MTNSRGESVGDMIVRIRIEEMLENPARQPEILARFTPRSIQRARWPLHVEQVSA